MAPSRPVSLSELYVHFIIASARAAPRSRTNSTYRFSQWFTINTDVGSAVYRFRFKYGVVTDQWRWFCGRRNKRMKE